MTSTDLAVGGRVSHKEGGGFYGGTIMSVSESRVVVMLDPWKGMHNKDTQRIEMTSAEAVTASNRWQRFEREKLATEQAALKSIAGAEAPKKPKKSSGRKSERTATTASMQRFLDREEAREKSVISMW